MNSNNYYKLIPLFNVTYLMSQNLVCCLHRLYGTLWFEWAYNDQQCSLCRQCTMFWDTAAFCSSSVF